MSRWLCRLGRRTRWSGAHWVLAKACVRSEWFAVTPAEAVAAMRKAADPQEQVGPVLPDEWKPRPVPDLDVLPLFGFRREAAPTATVFQVRPRSVMLNVCRAVIGRRSTTLGASSAAAQPDRRGLILRQRKATISQPTSVPAEPSASEVAIALEFYKAACWGSQHCQNNIQEIYKLYISISATLLTGSLAANAFGHPSLALVCCITPCLSWPFAKWRQLQSKEIADYANFLRLEFSEYVADHFPKLRSKNLGVLNWDYYGASPHSDSRSLFYHETISSILLLHFPSFLSLTLALLITLSSMDVKVPNFHCIHGDHLCEAHLWLSSLTKHYRELLPILFASGVWAMALRVSWDRYRKLLKALAQQGSKLRTHIANKSA